MQQIDSTYRFNALDVMTHLKIDAATLELVLSVLGQFRVERTQNLWCDIVQCYANVW